MNFDNLKAMKPEALRALAVTQGLKVHRKAKPETIIKQIMEKALAPAKQEMQHAADKPKAPVFHNTQDEVEAAIADIKARVPQFEAKYGDDNTWHFRCKGAEDSGNMDIPLRVIKMKAQTVSRGRLVLMGMKDFGTLGSNPKSAYTDTVLVGHA